MKSTRVSLFLILGYLSIALIGVGGYAGGQTLVGTTTDPTGIDGLVIDGTTYNVTFSTTTYQSPFFQGTEASIGAANVMAATLSSLGITELAETSPPVDCPPDNHVCQQNAVLFVAVDNVPGLNDVASCGNGAGPASPICSEHSWSTPPLPYDTVGDTAGQGHPLGFSGSGWGYAADFTAVPEPGTLALLVIGLAGVGFVRRRRHVDAV